MKIPEHTARMKENGDNMNTNIRMAKYYYFYFSFTGMNSKVNLLCGDMS